MKQDDAFTEQQMLAVFFAATFAVLVAVVVGFLFFAAWSRRDRAKRSAQVHQYTGQKLDD